MLRVFLEVRNPNGGQLLIKGMVGDAIEVSFGEGLRHGRKTKFNTFEMVMKRGIRKHHKKYVLSLKCAFFTNRRKSEKKTLFSLKVCHSSYQSKPVKNL